MISRADLEILLRHRASPSVTITMPTDSGPTTVRQNSTRVANLIGESERKLVALGHDPAESVSLLGPARALIGDDAFWAANRRGLALFLAAGIDRIFNLPRAVEELVTVGEHFRIAPLLPFVGERKTAFYLLAATTSGATLYRADAEGMRPEDVALPQGVQSVAGDTDYEQTSHANPASGAAPSDQSLGSSPEDLRKAQLMHYLNKLAAAVKARIGHVRVPVVLAAQPELAGNFRKQSELSNLWPQHLAINPDAVDAEELRRRAWQLLADEIEDDAGGSIDHFNSLFQGRSPRAETHTDEVVRASRWGRLDTLIIGAGLHVWGRFDEQADRVETHLEPLAGDDDLLDLAASQTLLNGGEVKVVDRDHVPGGGFVAAILRY